MSDAAKPIDSPVMRRFRLFLDSCIPSMQIGMGRNQVKNVFHEIAYTAEKVRRNMQTILSESIKLLKELRLASISACT